MPVHLLIGSATYCGAKEGLHSYLRLEEFDSRSAKIVEMISLDIACSL